MTKKCAWNVAVFANVGVTKLSKKEEEKIILSYCEKPRSKRDIISFTKLSKRKVGSIIKRLVETNQLSKYHNLNDLRSYFYRKEYSEISTDNDRLPETVHH